MSSVTKESAEDRLRNRFKRCSGCRSIKHRVCSLCIYFPFKDALTDGEIHFRGGKPREGEKHLELKDRAVKWIRAHFSSKSPIAYEWGKLFVDVVSISKSVKIAIEVGDCYGEKLNFLAQHFDKVYHWPYGADEPHHWPYDAKKPTMGIFTLVA